MVPLDVIRQAVDARVERMHGLSGFALTHPDIIDIGHAFARASPCLGSSSNTKNESLQPQTLSEFIHRDDNPLPRLLHGHNLDDLQYWRNPSSPKASRDVLYRALENFRNIRVGEAAMSTALDASKGVSGCTRRSGCALPSLRSSMAL